MRVALVALQGHHLSIAHNFCITDFELRKHILYVVGTVQPYDLFVCHEAVLLLWRMVAGTSWETSARRCETWGIRVEVTSRIQVRSSTHASALAGLGERHWDVDCIGSDGIYWADSNVWFQYVRCHIISYTACTYIGSQSLIRFLSVWISQWGSAMVLHRATPMLLTISHSQNPDSAQNPTMPHKCFRRGKQWHSALDLVESWQDHAANVKTFSVWDGQRNFIEDRTSSRLN